jgi:hypothetical protein
MTEAATPLPPWRRWPVPASYLTASGMILCFAAVLTRFLAWLFPTMDSRSLLLVCALAILEAFASFWLVKHLPTAQRQPVYYRGTELVILFVALKLFAELRAGPAVFWNNFLLWPVQFPMNLVTGRFLLVLVPVLSAWAVSNLFASDLFLLGTEEAIYTDDRNQRTPVRTRILRRFLNLGILVIILAGIPPQNLLPTALPVASNSVPAVVIFFVLGLILVSLTRYINLETNWWQAKLHVPVQIPQRWFAYTALILLALILLISWLPTYYGMGLLDTLNAVFSLVYQVFMTIYGLILLGITLLVNLLNKQPPVDPQQIQEPPIAPEGLPIARIATFNWELVKSVLLWGGLIVFIIIALRQYISFNRDLAEELRRFRPVHWLMAAWEKFKASFKKANQTVGIFIQNSLKRLRRSGSEAAKTGEWDFINPRRLSPRQKILFYYLALVRRARDAGIPRQENQTPYEYARSLTTAIEEEKESVDAMTASFIEARYSRHDIPAREARRAESIWEAIRNVLQNARKSRRSERPKDD